MSQNMFEPLKKRYKLFWIWLGYKWLTKWQKEDSDFQNWVSENEEELIKEFEREEKSHE